MGYALLGVLCLYHTPLCKLPCAGLVVELPVSPYRTLEQQQTTMLTNLSLEWIFSCVFPCVQPPWAAICHTNHR